MPNLDFSIQSWGKPSSPKRALLLHGLMGTGTVWFKVAEILVAQGHGWAPHSRPYNVQTVTRHLADHLRNQDIPYEVIEGGGGVSFGSSFASSLYSSLPENQKPKRLVLAEPILDYPTFTKEALDGMVNSTKEIPSEESILKANPSWIGAEAILRRLSLSLIDPEVIVQLSDAMVKGEFSHSNLLPSQSASTSTEIMILGADPSVKTVYPPENSERLEKEYPYVKFGWVKGATHDMHKTDAGVLAKVIVGGFAGAEKAGVTVLRGSRNEYIVNEDYIDDELITDVFWPKADPATNISP
ncbi:hypothetical protein L486_07660 [Kwoniella mangroviensis CBS 10435]|uniref:AB hydrolase-1 domain-containing protein n=1 Tax=Kwoniella mangroviensis CBS 10435 TaxID=1331196 RepID=A0A1B9IHZ3_9TREE|nr:hypothetical protein L486_07660 [Kwoniella mangroviensis CBS 10435]OCF73025.1 hypothetical protein I204_06255 [Kwoniella mangroviensis CBS 8886]